MRKSIEVAGYKHGNPIPAASRIGNLVMSGVISAKNAQTGNVLIMCDFTAVID